MGEVDGGRADPGLLVRDAHLWMERCARTINSVCCVEIDDAPAGTGFLVGPSVILTNYHVIEGALDPLDPTGRKLRYPVKCRFDYRRVAGGGVDPGIVVDVVPNCLDLSPPSKAEKTPDPFDPAPTNEELDFALLRLVRDVGNGPVRDAGTNRRRGWINFPHDPPVPATGEIVVIVQHQLGGPTGFDQRDFIAPNPLGNRFRYYNRTTRGSSGSPCLTLTHDLIAIHHLGDSLWSNGEFSQGVPAKLIRNRLIPVHGAEIAEFIDTRQFGNADAVESYVTVVRNDPQASERARERRDLIQAAHRGTQRLRLYKVAHEFLQTAQKLMAEIDDLLREVEELEHTLAGFSSAEGGAAQAHMQAVEKHLRSMKSKIQNLGEALKRQCGQPRTRLNLHFGVDPTPLPFSFTWIEDVADDAARLEHFSTGDREASWSAVVGIQQVLRHKPAELNRAIIEQIDALQFDALHRELANVSAALPQLRGQHTFDAGPEALHQAWQAVQAETRDHDIWQDIENRLIEIKAQLRADSTSGHRTFKAMWPRVAGKVSTLCAAAATAGWSREMTQAMQAVSAALEKGDWDLVDATYTTFWRAAEDRFSQVDKNLLSGCEDIVRMGDRLALLAGDGP